MKTCKFNLMVLCEEQDKCSSCSWNPEVMEARKAASRKSKKEVKRNEDNDFGTTYLYKFADEAGNVFIWYASRPIELQERMTLKATIKAHNERNGVKQTVLTRCKVVA